MPGVGQKPLRDAVKLLLDEYDEPDPLPRTLVERCGLMDRLDALREALPDTEVWYSPGDESSGGTWRCDEDYYAMRDAFHMYYMDVDGETVERMSEEELAAVHQKFWGY